MANRPPRYVYVEGQANERLVRDTFSMGVIDVNRGAYALAKRQQAEAMKKIAAERQESLDLQKVKKDVAELQLALGGLDRKLDLLLNALGVDK